MEVGLGLHGDAAEADAIKLQDIIDRALNNYEVVKSICSATSSVKDLLNFRLVNTTFHYEATVRMRVIPASVDLQTYKSMESFLAYLKTSSLDLVSPFTAFKLGTQYQSAVLDQFLAVAPAARHYAFQRKYWTGYETDIKEGRVVALCLSSSPLLRSLYLWNDHFLSEEDLALLPPLTNLQVIQVGKKSRPEEKLPGTTSLVSTLLAKSSSPLKHLKIPPLEIEMPGFDEFHFHYATVFIPDMADLRVIAQNHVSLRTVSMCEAYYDDKYTIRPHTLDVFDELIKMGIKFRDLALETYLCYSNEEETPESMKMVGIKLLETTSAWLNRQSANLVSLNLAQQVPNGTLSLPQFPTLTKFCLDVRGLKTCQELEPLAKDQFPALRELRLHVRGYGDMKISAHQNVAKIFAQAYLPSVETFELDLGIDESVVFPDYWKKVLPNITKLWLTPTTAKSLAVILTQYSQLIDLHVNLVKHKEAANNYWEILTNGAPRPLEISSLMNTERSNRNLELKEVVNENCDLYRVPSLQNMTALKKLVILYELFDGGTNELDAVVYMTHANLIVPLQEIQFLHIKDMKENTRMEYEKMLAKYHGKAKIIKY